MITFSRKAIIFFMIGGPIWFISIVLSLVGLTVFSYAGFAVDNSGLLYVGENSKIDVYDDGEFFDTVYNTTRGYRFTIRNDNIVLVSDGVVRILDLSGNEIEKYDDNDFTPDSEYINLEEQKNVFETGDSKYVATNVFGFYTITKHSNDGNEEIVFHIPVVDFILYTARWIFSVLFPIIFIKTYIKWWREEDKKRRLARRKS